MFVVLMYAPLQDAWESSRRAQCTNNLKQIALAMHNYHSVNNHFPGNAYRDAAGRPLLSWRIALLPYLGQANLYARFKLDEPWDSPNNISLVGQMPATYACPNDPTQLGDGRTAYQAFVGPRTVFDGIKPVAIQDILDGTSEHDPRGGARKPVTWTAPDDLALDPSIPNLGLGSRHRGGLNVAFADGAVRLLKYTINPSILSSLITRNGGEVVNPASY